MTRRHHTDDVLALAFGQNLSIWVSGAARNGAHPRISCGCSCLRSRRRRAKSCALNRLGCDSLVRLGAGQLLAGFWWSLRRAASRLMFLATRKSILVGLSCLQYTYHHICLMKNQFKRIIDFLNCSIIVFKPLSSIADSDKFKRLIQYKMLQYLFS